MTTRVYVVDRLEGQVAVLATDDGATVDVERGRLPARVKEGTVLRIKVGPKGVPDWASAEIDSAEQEQRLKQARELLDQMKRTDPGGDITL